MNQHCEFRKYRQGSRGMIFDLDTPGISYCILGTSKGHSCKRTSKGRGLNMKDNFARFLHEVETWERVERLPDDCVEIYDIAISIIGGACLIRCKVGRKYLECFGGYVEVIEIDDTDN